MLLGFGIGAPFILRRVAPAVGGNLVLTAETAFITLTGEPMTPLVDLRLPAEGGTVAISGQDATLTKSGSNLLSNGDFSSGTYTGWTASAYSYAGGSIVSGVEATVLSVVSNALRVACNQTPDYAFSTAVQTVSGLTIGVTYNISVDVSNIGTNTARIKVTTDTTGMGGDFSLGSSVYDSGAITANGNVSGSFVATQTSHTMALRVSSPFGPDPAYHIDFDNATMAV